MQAEPDDFLEDLAVLLIPYLPPQRRLVRHHGRPLLRRQPARRVHHQSITIRPQPEAGLRQGGVEGGGGQSMKLKNFCLSCGARLFSQGRTVSGFFAMLMS